MVIAGAKTRRSAGAVRVGKFGASGSSSGTTTGSWRLLLGNEGKVTKARKSFTASGSEGSDWSGFSSRTSIVASEVVRLPIVGGCDAAFSVQDEEEVTCCTAKEVVFVKLGSVDVASLGSLVDVGSCSFEFSDDGLTRPPDILGTTSSFSTPL